MVEQTIWPVKAKDENDTLKHNHAIAYNGTFSMLVPRKFASNYVADTLLNALIELVANVRIAGIFSSVQTLAANQLQSKTKKLVSSVFKR